MWLLVGLGNPGPKYSQNRHNIGFMVVDELARRKNAESFRGKFGGEVTTCEVGGEKCALLKPLEFMNLSGRSASRSAAATPGTMACAPSFRISARPTSCASAAASVDRRAAGPSPTSS